MSYEPVDVYIKDQLGNPVPAVTVRIFNAAGSVFFTQGVTDTNGKASFLLFTQEYSMRFNRFSTGFEQPQLFTVLEAPSLNSFNVLCEVFNFPVSGDSRLCRCSGYFRNPDGSPQTYLDMHFYPEFGPMILDSAMVTPRTMVARTDEDGYLQLDLIRGGCYRVTVEGLDNEERYIRVPDLAGTNLANILLPIVSRVTFDPAGPYALTVGLEIEVTPTVYDSAGVVLHGTGQNDVDWTVSDTNLASVSVGELKLTIRGNSTGSVELRAARRDRSVVQIPDTPISGQPLAITIT